MKTSTIVSVLLRLAIAALLLMAVFPKFSSAPESVAVFKQLGMEPPGRYLIGSLESIAALLVLLPLTAPWGAILAWGLMTGAIIAHSSQLGWTGGNLPLGAMAAGIWLASVVVIFLERRRLPFLRHMLEFRAEEENVRP